MSIADPGADDLTRTCFRDDLWLASFPLNAATVLDYFAISPFYDRNCNNEKAKQQGIDPSRLMTLAPGVEYVLQDCQEPHLYVIRKQMRTSVKDASPVCVYYVLDGSVYQAPTLHSVLLSRMRRCLFNIRSAFGTMRVDLEPLAKEEESASEPVASSHAALLSSFVPPPQQQAGQRPAAAAAGALSRAAAVPSASGATASASGATYGTAIPSARKLVDVREERRKTDRIIATVLNLHPLPKMLQRVQQITAAAAVSGPGMSNPAAPPQEGQQVSQAGPAAGGRAASGLGSQSAAPSQQQQQGGGAAAKGPAEQQPSSKRARAS